jgi:hypothetical protein
MRSALRVAGVLVALSLAHAAGADRVTITGTLSHDLYGGPDALGLDGASVVFVVDAEPDATPTSSGTQGGPGAFQHATYATTGSLSVAGSLGGGADGNYTANGGATFRSPVDPGEDWIEIFGYANALAQDAFVVGNVFFANNAVFSGDPFDFLAFSSAQTTVTGSIEIGGEHGGGVSYDLLAGAATGTLPEADAAGLGAVAMLALAALPGRRRVTPSSPSGC